MKLLTFTSLYPNAENPSHGVFVENRLVHLVGNGRVSSLVIAPVPWFPFRHPRFGRYGAFARVPGFEQRRGIEIRHPRFLAIPGLGGLTAPFAMALAARAALSKRIAAGERFDAIDAHYFFPDGVAAALLGQWFGLPVVITARGSDINVIARGPLAGRMIRWAAGTAVSVIAVSRALRQAIIDLGVEASKVVVLRNGIDTDRFSPLDRPAARRALGLAPEAPAIVSVGRLVALKGHDLVIDAMLRLPGVHLLIAGDGPERIALEARARRLGIAGRVHFLGQVRHDDLPGVYSAADALVLASSNEGWPNVLLEAMACGTPVVATDVGGCSEVVTAPEAGTIVRERSADAIATALKGLFANPPDRAATRRHAERYGWDETTRGQEQVFETLRGVPQGAVLRGSS